MTAGACAVLLGAAPAASASCPGESAPAAVMTEAEIEASIGCLLNERRASVGLRPLRPDERLRAAAVGHSLDMVRGGYFAHVSLAGVRFHDRIRAAGYTKGARRWIVGENLAWGSAETSSPATLVNSWMTNPPHRANVLRKVFREIGIGVIRGTPEDEGDVAGITVSTEYGFRKRGKRGRR